MVKVEVEFTCDKCGLLTPAFAEIPDNIAPERLIALEHFCFHCNTKLMKVVKLCDLNQN